MRIIGIDVPGFGVPTHAEAKDVLAGAMLQYARSEVEQGPVQAPRAGRSDRPTVTLLGEMFPADPVGIGMMLEPLGLAAGPVVPTREWRELYAALDCAVVAAIHPFYTAAIREFEAAGRPIVGSAPVGTTAPRPGCKRSATPATSRTARIDAAKNRFLPAIRGALAQDARSTAASRCRATKAPSCWSRACWSRAAPICAMSAPPARARRGRDADREWLEARGVHVQYRASLEQDLAAMQRVQPGPRDRHDAGRADGQAAGDPVALLHQPDLGAAADGSGRRRLARAGGQRRDRQQGALRRDERLLRRRRRGPRRRRLGGRCRRTVPSSEADTARRWKQAEEAQERRQ